MIDEETKALTIIVSYCYLVYVWVIASCKTHLPILQFIFVHLQDYEYSSFNPVAYDIANHFCEMAADYHSEEPHLLDYTKYPGILHGCCLSKLLLSVHC
jgi:hypothetical protein